jgi:ribosomal protein L14E/L6E/L27E
LWESDSDAQIQQSKIEVEARRCVILAIIDPKVINFDEVLSLKAIKHLQSKDKEIFDLISAFTLNNTKDFITNVKKFEKLLKSEKIDMDQVIQKKQYIEICS